MFVLQFRGQIERTSTKEKPPFCTFFKPLTKVCLSFIIFETEERAVEKLHQYNNVLLNAVCETENSISSYKADYNSYSEFKNMIEKSGHYYKVANIRYTNGTGNRIDELAARRQFLVNENSMYLAKISALVDTINIYKALGGSIN